MKLQYCVNRTGAVPPEKLALTGLEVQKAARAFHSTIPGYEPTPLTALDHLARRLGVSQVLVKDESKRFGLNAFKALGGSYAMARYLGEQLGLGRDQLTFEALGTPGGPGEAGGADLRHRHRRQPRPGSGLGRPAAGPPGGGVHAQGGAPGSGWRTSGPRGPRRRSPA